MISNNNDNLHHAEVLAVHRGYEQGDRTPDASKMALFVLEYEGGNLVEVDMNDLPAMVNYLAARPGLYQKLLDRVNPMIYSVEDVLDNVMPANGQLCFYFGDDLASNFGDDLASNEDF